MPERDPRKEKRFVAMSQETIVRLIGAPESATKLWLALADMMKWFTEPGSWVAGESWPSWRYLRDKYGLSFKAIAAGIKTLAKLGLLHVRTPKKGSTHYFLNGFVLLQRGAAARTGAPADCSPQESSAPPNALPRRADCSPQESGLLSPGEHSILKRPGREQPGKNEGEAPPPHVAAEGPTEQDLHEVLARLQLRGTPVQKRQLVGALVARLGSAAAAAKFLELPDLPGRDVLDIHTDEIDRFKKAGPSAPRAPDPGCEGCRGSGKRRAEQSGFETPCKCTWRS